MAIIQLKPRTPGQRFMQVLDFSELTKKPPEKRLLAPLKRTGGRNNQGRITCRFRGGGHPRRLRIIDFKRNKDGVPATVAAIEYDPNRSANIALLHYRDGDKRYILAPVGLKVGDTVESGPQADIKPGNALPLADIPVGTMVLARCRATVGQVGNLDHENVSLGKAGRSRHLGRRPHVRGIAMNPVDHPHGGGEGRSKGNHPQSPWGMPTKGYKTRGKKPSDRYIISRRPSGSHS